MLASTPTKAHPAYNSVVALFREWARKRRLIRQRRQRLDALDNNEIAHIARDVGLSPSDLRQMAQFGPDAAKLVLDRMAVLHLDADALAKCDPSTMHDLQRLCTSCASKRRCQRDLLLVPGDQNWRHYCPNVGTLDALQSGAAKAC